MYAWVEMTVFQSLFLNSTHQEKLVSCLSRFDSLQTARFFQKMRRHQ